MSGQRPGKQRTSRNGIRSRHLAEYLGTLTFPTGNPGDTTGTAFPYPLLWAEFNFDSNQGKNVAGASLQPLHDSYTISGSESNIFDATTTFSYEGTGSGSVSEPT